MPEDEGAAAEKRKRELKGDIDHKFVQFDDFPRAFGEGVEGLYVQPRGIIIGGLTGDDPPQIGPALLDSSNRLDVVSSPYGIGQGTIRGVQGTYTKGATGTTGTLTITPHADDVLYFMYGVIAMGGARAGGVDELTAGVKCGAGYMQVHLYDATADASETWYLPALGEVNTTVEKTSGVYHSLQTMMPGTNLVTSDVGTLGSSAYVITCAVMANTEEFSVRLAFYSAYNKAVTVTAGTSDAFA